MTGDRSPGHRPAPVRGPGPVGSCSLLSREALARAGSALTSQSSEEPGHGMGTRPGLGRPALPPAVPPRPAAPGHGQITGFPAVQRGTTEVLRFQFFGNVSGRSPETLQKGDPGPVVLSSTPSPSPRVGGPCWPVASTETLVPLRCSEGSRSEAACPGPGRGVACPERDSALCADPAGLGVSAERCHRRLLG